MSAKTVLRLLRPALQAERRGDFDAAVLLAEAQVKAHPRQIVLDNAAAAMRQEAILRHLRRGEDDRARRAIASAAVEFRSALDLDNSNQQARRDLAAALEPNASTPPDAIALRVARSAPPVALDFDHRRHDITFRGQSRTLIATVAAAYGLRAYVQNAVRDRPVEFAIGQATFAQAMGVLRNLLGVSWTALDPRTIYVGLASQARDFEPLAERTFYLPGSATANDATAMAQLLRVMLSPHSVGIDLARHALTVRARPEKLDAAEKLLLDLASPPGQVVFEVRILAASDTFERQLGLSLPYQLQAVALGPILAQLGQSASEQQLINELFSQGGLNGLLGAGALAQQLAQLQSQLSPLLSSSFAIFGGGLTAMALTIPPATLNLSLTEASSREMEQSWLGASAGQEATLKIGERFPIANTIFSPILLNSAIQKVIANGSFAQPFPSISYQDLGLDLTLTPYLDAKDAVSVKIKAQERALAGQSANGIPILADRTLQTMLQLHDGEPAVIAGLRTEMFSETKTAAPVLGSIPLLGPALSNHSTRREHQDLLVVVIPHIVRNPNFESAAIWLPVGEFATPAGFR